MVRQVVGVLVAIVGGIWFFQGIGVIHGSFMTNSVLWLVIGAVVAVGGLAFAFVPRRRG